MDKEDQDRFALDAAAHQIPCAFATADRYQAAQLTCLSYLGQHPQLRKVENAIAVRFLDERNLFTHSFHTHSTKNANTTLQNFSYYFTNNPKVTKGKKVLFTQDVSIFTQNYPTIHVPLNQTLPPYSIPNTKTIIPNKPTNCIFSSNIHL